MAEAVAFTLASKVLSSIASPAFTAAYKEGLSIWEAEDELSKLQVTIETIQAVLLDAEKKQQGTNAVRNWIKRLKSILYDADDLLDKVATQDLLKQQILKGNHNFISKKVQVSFSMLNPIVSRYSIATEVKAIRKTLVEISTDMAPLGFMISQNEVPTTSIRTEHDPGSFVDAQFVVGRERDKKDVLKMLCNESNSAIPVPFIIVIVGIGGMGKRTLAQLIYNDDEVERNFDNRWFVCVSDTSDEREFLGKIYRSIHGRDHSSFNLGELQVEIKDSVKDRKFLLVLDDVFEDHRGRWQDRISLLSSCANGSTIIVTTRLPSLVNAMNASRAKYLEGLSEEDAWCLFKRFAFSPDYENDPIRISMGREILKRCRGVPLAIRSMGSLLSDRNTISEWQAIEREALRTVEKSYNDETMRVIKLSYDNLPSNLKHCFAYCSLFPKDYRFMKQELICLWLAQGYIEPNNEETDFMYLLRRGFFQEVEKDVLGEVQSCKMHDIMHDLALYVAGEESIAVSRNTSWNTTSFARHVSLEDFEKDVPLLKVKRPLRTCLLTGSYSTCSHKILDKLFQNFKMLRTLSLKGLGITKKLPPSIGELTLLRYLDLSFNYFQKLPESMTNLVNLLGLNLMGCTNLIALPRNFRKLINLKYLNIKKCLNLEKMPVRIEELTHLQFLSEYVIGKRSELDALVGLHQQLRGELLIKFKNNIMDEDGSWKLPVCLQLLEIRWYMGIRIPGWGAINGIDRRNNHLAHLRLSMCKWVEHLPPLQCLPSLRWLEVDGLWSLQFMESEEDYAMSSSPFFPCLQKLTLKDLPELKRWMKSPNPYQFPLLSDLSIEECPALELASFPLCRRLQELLLNKVDVDNDVTLRQLPSTLFSPSSSTPLEFVTIRNCKWLWSLPVEATASLGRLEIQSCSSLENLQIVSPDLRLVEILGCHELVSIEAATPFLKDLRIECCKELRNLMIAPPLNALERLLIAGCPVLDLWEMEWDWDSLANLRVLDLNPMPPMGSIPIFLRNRHTLGQLQITQTQAPWEA